MASKKPKTPKRKKPQDHPPSKPLSRHSIKKKKNKSKNPNHVPLGKNKTLAEKMKNREEEKKKSAEADRDTVLLSTVPVAEQLRFFLNLFQSANKLKLSTLELEAFKDTSMVRLAEDMDQDVENLSKHMKAVFGTSWKEVLCEGKLSEGTIDAGSPAVLIISTSALRSLELLRYNILSLDNTDELVFVRVDLFSPFIIIANNSVASDKIILSWIFCVGYLTCTYYVN
ncbi:hypothetical protein COCNU_scaffold003913G000020 [Cocos nucifera]|nr:hypothetical protein [Cocos nucifera]EHA8588024.1 hypothetical protein [Cocos nucifera]